MYSGLETKTLFDFGMENIPVWEEELVEGMDGCEASCSVRIENADGTNGTREFVSQLEVRGD